MFPVVEKNSRHGLRSSALAVVAVLLFACCLLSLPLSFVLTGAPALNHQRKLRTPAKAVDATVLEVGEDSADTAVSAAPTGAYVAMNRFRVREGSGPAFEQRWAQRKSSLRELQGFQWFALLRRVQSPDPEDDYSYSSFTWWANKKNFNSWRKGPAFKEAHGGGDIFSFLGMIVNGFLTSKGPPKPCFWKGEAVLLNAPLVGKFQGGPGSKPDFDGSKEMDSEVFVSMRRFGSEEGIEKVPAEESQKVAGASGLRFAQVVSRDQEPDDGAGAALITVWNSKKDYEASALTAASAPPRGEALYEGILVLEK